MIYKLYHLTVILQEKKYTFRLIETDYYLPEGMGKRWMFLDEEYSLITPTVVGHSGMGETPELAINDWANHVDFESVKELVGL
jgi:hypothetical protein